MARMKLGVMFSNGSGKLGNVVVNKGKGGTVVVRERVTPNNPKTGPQVAARNAQTKSSQTFKNFSTAQVAAWVAYAATLPQVSKRSGRKMKVQAINAYGALADKYLQVNPAGNPPVVPPTSAFPGDSLAVSATAGTGLVTFTATAGNSAGVTTELLLQALKSKNRTPTSRNYRSKKFFAFTAGSLTTTVAVPTGFYAAGYRFVNTNTGQASPLVPLTVLTILLSLEDGGMDDAGFEARAA